MEKQERWELEKYHKAKKRVEDIKGFYIHLICFLVINPLLIYINYVTYWEHKWFIYALVGWSCGLMAHGVSVFGFGRNWEDRKIREFMNREN